MKILPGTHVSPETAYLVDDYPYGFKLRCQMRYWLEHKPKHGFRLMQQTSNPKKPGTWNKPKAGTYARFGAALYLDDADHVHCAGLSEYSTGAGAKAWSDEYRAGVPAIGLDMLDRWVAAKLAYDGARTKDDPLHVGLREARKAMVADPAPAPGLRTVVFDETGAHDLGDVDPANLHTVLKDIVGD